MRLQKVIVQAVFLDDDDREHPTDPLVIHRQDWEAFRSPGGGFDQATEQVLAQALAATNGEASTVTAS